MKKAGEINNVDGLRALAVLSVFFHHVNHVYQFNVPFLGEFGGIIGVQLFFLISGFLIIQSAERHSLRAYILHRVFRIYPVYILIFLTAGIASGAIYWGKIYDNPWGLISNLVALQHLFPKQLIIYDSLHVTWTLTIEVLWYSLAPMMLHLFLKRLNLTLAVSVLASIVWVYFAAQGSLDWIYSAQLAELDESIEQRRSLLLNNAFIAQCCFFFIGVYIYYKQERLKAVNKLILLSIFIAGTLLYPFWARQEFNPSFVTGIGLGALFVLALTLPTLSSRVVKLIADVSYSFYLTHFFVIIVLHQVLELHSKWAIVLAFGLTLFVSAVLFRFVERPMMRAARRLS